MKHRKVLAKWFSLLFPLVVGLAACGPAQPPEGVTREIEEDAGTAEPTAPEQATEEQSTTAEAVQSSAGQETEVPEATDFDIYGGASVDDVISTDSGLQYLEIVEGDGPSPEVGEVVSVHYTGWLEDGTKFDSSLDRGVPFQFALGQGMVIPGWDEGIALLKQGSKARLIIPPEIGYGPAGSGPIPPNATLVFEVELVDIRPGSPAEPTEVEEADYTVLESGLKFYDLEPGDGPMPESGQQLVLHYTGWLEDGTKFDSSLDRGQPIVLVLDSDQAIEGWHEGLATMHVGGVRQLVIPPELAFGEEGAGGGVIPPGATLIFEMELLEVQ